MVAGNGNRAAAASQSQSPQAVAHHALQVIILGSGGGPREDNTTAFLVRSIAANWKEGSLLAVDAGVHLSAIAKILKQTKDSPFASLPLPHPSTLTNSANANAAYITSELVRTYLITHPHLDHISGFVVNTAFKQENPKYLAALPVTLEAFRNHIFNDVIWPNLSDENDGPGVVKYMELVEGGSGLSRHLEGYVPICEGLSVRAFAVSHGRNGHRVLNGKQKGSAILPPAGNDTRIDNNGLLKTKCSYDSSAFFIRDESGASGKEVLVFGDVEPDSIAHEPRNKKVWKEAASKVASGKLGGILIECSFDDGVKEEDLFGHMAPKFLIAELKVLATEVTTNRKGTSSNRNGSPLNITGADLKRKRRESGDYDHSQPTAQRRRSTSPSHLGSNVQTAQEPPGKATANNGSSSISPPPDKFHNEPLKGIKIVIIHIKERLQVGVDESAVILQQLREYEGEAGLGCEFIISKVGESVYF